MLQHHANITTIIYLVVLYPLKILHESIISFVVVNIYYSFCIISWNSAVKSFLAASGKMYSSSPIVTNFQSKDLVCQTLPVIASVSFSLSLSSSMRFYLFHVSQSLTFCGARIVLKFDTRPLICEHSLLSVTCPRPVLLVLYLRPRVSCFSKKSQ